MRFSVIVGTFGEEWWHELAQTRACASVQAQRGFDASEVEVIALHSRSLQEARNGAAWRAQGDYLIFLDADDRLEPGYLAAMSEAIDERMEAPGPISATWALYYPAVQYDAQAPRILTPKRPGAHVRDAILDGNWMVVGTAIHRNLFWRAGSFGPERAWEDWALWMRAIMVGAHTCAVPSAIYQATTNANGRNRNIDRPKELFEEIIRANESWRRAQELQQG